MAMVTALLLQDSYKTANWTTVYTNQPKISSEIFCFWMHENCSKLCSSILTFVSHYPVLHNVNFFAGRHFFIRKMKIKMDFVISVLKVVESSVICDIWNSSLHTIVVRLFDRREIQLTNQPTNQWPTVRNTCFQKLQKILVFKSKHY